MNEAAAIPVRPPWTASPEEVSAFVQRYGRPYDAVTDDYEDPGPFAHAVKEGKNSPIYNAHAYHTKVPPEGNVHYLEHYTRPGDLVLDPFCGSGMTGVACLMTGRHAILNNLSPAATHIAYNYCNPIDTVALRAEWERIREAVREEFAWLYGTTCDRGHPAEIVYTVWSDVHLCRSCREEIILWNAAVDRERGVVKERFHCPSCGKGPWKKTELPLLRSEPVLTVYECRGGCKTARRKPKRGQRPPSASERARLAEIEARTIPYWYPTTPFGEEREMWRGGHRDHGIERVCDFWTKRNLWAIAAIWQRISTCFDDTLLRGLSFVFTASMLRGSRMYKYTLDGKGGIVTGTLYLPSLSCELNVGLLFSRKLNDVTWAIGTASEVICTNGSAGELPWIPDNSIDYVFTDPPFGSNIFYADCSLLWEAWLGYFTDEQHEAVWNKKRKPDQGGKTLDDYERLMTEAFREMYRVLKPGRWASVVFHNSDDRVWQAIQRGAVAAGFELVGAQQLDKGQLSFKGVKGEKGEENVTNKDIVLNLQKLFGKACNGITLAPDAEDVIARAIVEHLSTRPDPDDRGLQALQGLAIRALINLGYQVEVSWRSVTKVLRQLGCKQVDGYWFLPGEEVASATYDIRDEASAIGWLRNLIQREGPQTRGGITPRFRQASVGVPLRKSLSELLEENFVLDERTNAWRLPTPQERERLNDVTVLNRRREINRLVEGNPARRYTDADLVELALTAYAMELYQAVLKIAPLPRTDVLSEEQRNALRQVQELARLKLEIAQGDRPTQARLL